MHGWFGRILRRPFGRWSNGSKPIWKEMVKYYYKKDITYAIPFSLSNADRIYLEKMSLCLNWSETYMWPPRKFFLACGAWPGSSISSRHRRIMTDAAKWALSCHAPGWQICTYLPMSAWSPAILWYAVYVYCAVSTVLRLNSHLTLVCIINFAIHPSIENI